MLSRFGLSVAPGKNMSKQGRDGKQYARSIAEDVRQLRCNHRVRLIVCLLNESELRLLGVRLDEYRRQCEKQEIEFYHHPCIEMAAFDDPAAIFQACEHVNTRLSEDPEAHSIVHCRGGVGRAGTFAACFYLYKAHTNMVNNHEGRALGPRDAIVHVRKRRCPRALESRKQEDFVSEFYRYLQGQQRIEQSRQVVAAVEAEAPLLASRCADGSADVAVPCIGYVEA